ncbi:MAG TPA: hypothetical protein VEQ85_14070 [Lacipirellulaceae bacterium]|nr:hypothetical protein [Lacipirellulaceae bacterium]
MRTLIQSELPCDADDAWRRVQTLELLREVCWPLITLRPAAGATSLPAQWQAGESVVMRPRLFGLIPLGARVLYWERIDSTAREMQTREHDPLIRRWDHRIHIEPLGAGACRYTDDVEVSAGVLTLPVWLFTQWFYRHRQRRWRRVARRIGHAQADAGASPVRNYV